MGIRSDDILNTLPMNSKHFKERRNIKYPPPLPPQGRIITNDQHVHLEALHNPTTLILYFNHFILFLNVLFCHIYRI